MILSSSTRSRVKARVGTEVLRGLAERVMWVEANQGHGAEDQLKAKEQVGLS